MVTHSYFYFHLTFLRQKRDPRVKYLEDINLHLSQIYLD